MSRAYAPASFDPPEPAGPGFGSATLFRVFRCPACRTTLGRQRIGLVYDRDATGYGVVPIGHTIERVELARGLVPLDPTPDGTLRFGVPGRAYMAPATPAGTTRRSALRRGTLVLPSVEGGDPYHVGRHDPRRAREPSGEYVLALNRERATLPFVVTCLERSCRGHWLVAGLPSAAELNAASRSEPPV